MRGVDKVLKEKADLILFTGDLVNDLAHEMDGYMDVFDKLTAPMGVYSIFGNHDYGDYHPWPDRNEEHKRKEELAGKHLLTPMQQANLDKLKEYTLSSGGDYF